MANKKVQFYQSIFDTGFDDNSNSYLGSFMDIIDKRKFIYINQNKYCPTQMNKLSNEELFKIMIEQFYNYVALSIMAFRILIERKYIQIITKIDDQIIDIDTFVLNKSIHYLDMDIVINNDTLNIINNLMIYKSIMLNTNDDPNIELIKLEYHKKSEDEDYDRYAFINFYNNKIKIIQFRQLIQILYSKYKKIYITPKRYSPINKLIIFGTIGVGLYTFSIMLYDNLYKLK